MSSQKLKAKSLLIDTSKNYTNISINRTSKYLIYIHVINAPSMSKIEYWNSVACWFSHIFSTRLSILLDKGIVFENAYVRAIAHMCEDLKQHYNESDIRQIKFNFICVLPTDEGVKLYHSGNDFAVFQSNCTSDLIITKSCNTIVCDVKQIPKLNTILNVRSVSVFNYDLIVTLTVGKHLVDMCSLDYSAIEHKIKQLSENEKGYTAAYCTMYIEK